MSHTRLTAVLARPDVASWLKSACVYCPEIAKQLEDAFVPHFYGSTQKDTRPMETFLATYAKLRDWLLVKSGELEEWIRSDVLPLDERFEEAFSHRSKPASILDQEDVATWMEEAESYHKPFCATRFLILRRAAGETTRFPLMEYTEEEPIHVHALVELLRRCCSQLYEAIGFQQDQTGVDEVASEPAQIRPAGPTSQSRLRSDQRGPPKRPGSLGFGTKQVDEAGRADRPTSKPKAAAEELGPTDPPVPEPTGEEQIASRRSQKRKAGLEEAGTRPPAAPPSKRSKTGKKVNRPAAGSKQNGEELLLARLKRIQSTIEIDDKKLLQCSNQLSEVSEGMRRTLDLALKTAERDRLNLDRLSNIGDNLLRIKGMAEGLVDGLRNMTEAISEPLSDVSDTT